ncbi:protein SSUH2 homolog [Trichonephila clavipes]|uniref:Protein SSUH2 homolog n=1 Tax=Trichonephila clavipes TaxID=2585209 RepID=A0A8X6R8H8_TRICX|nr:protein SSUH2 homolog [Trichonephila clavipes]
MSHSRDTALVPTMYLVSSDGIEPPTYEESEAEFLARSLNTTPSPGRPLLTLVSLDDEDLRRFCYKYIEDDCCYGSRFIKDMILTQIWNDCAFLYTVESLTEKRETCLTHTPYNGRLEDGPEEEGSPPDRWLVHVNAPTIFVDNSTTREIPFSAYIKVCHRCNGQKQWSCSHCDARGKEKCQKCNGRGWYDDYACSKCAGTGKVTYVFHFSLKRSDEKIK